MSKLFSILRRAFTRVVFYAGHQNFYGFRSRVWVLFSAHVYVGVHSRRILIEICL